MNEEVLKTIIEFEKLPTSEEKEAIRTAYLSDELSPGEFWSKAKRYLDSRKELTE